MNALIIIFLLLSYLLGAVPNGLLVARINRIDIRKVGSGNIGATNVFRSVGKKWGILTFVLDFSKGCIPALAFPALVRMMTGGEAPFWLALACGLAAVAGHNWPVYLGFKGGKGVATSTGALTGIVPAAVGIGFLVWILLFVTSRYVSIASLGAALTVAAGGWILYPNENRLIPVVLTILALFIIWRHTSNIQRLANGTENRFSFKKKET